MKKILHTPLSLVGRTPLLRLSNIGHKLGLKADIYAKAECYNPLGSVKDRVALAMIRDGERRGLVNEGSVIIEPTSGNTGIGISFVCACLGYKAVIVMPENASAERRAIISSLGASLVLTDSGAGMVGASDVATALCGQIEHSFMPNQFDNPANPMIHRLTTAPEIFAALRGRVDIFVCGVGTGGTISGVGGFLKSKDPSVKIIAVEPSSSAVLSGGSVDMHSIEGIGAGFIPGVLNTSIIDEVVNVSDDDARLGMDLLCKSEGIFAGMSSGAAFFVCMTLAALEENSGKNIITIFPDSRDRYLRNILQLDIKC